MSEPTIPPEQGAPEITRREIPEPRIPELQPTDYEGHVNRVLEVLIGDVLPLTSWFDPEQVEERITIVVRDATGLEPERWDRLSRQKRIPWLQKTLNVLLARPKPNAILEGEPIYLPQIEASNEAKNGDTNTVANSTVIALPGLLTPDVVAKDSKRVRRSDLEAFVLAVREYVAELNDFKFTNPSRTLKKGSCRNKYIALNSPKPIIGGA